MLNITNKKKLTRKEAEKGIRQKRYFSFPWLLSWVSIGEKAFFMLMWMIRLVSIIMPVRMEHMARVTSCFFMVSFRDWRDRKEK